MSKQKHDIGWRKRHRPTPRTRTFTTSELNKLAAQLVTRGLASPLIAATYRPTDTRTWRHRALVRRATRRPAPTTVHIFR
jgi:hypothetical protein